MSLIEPIAPEAILAEARLIPAHWSARTEAGRAAIVRGSLRRRHPELSDEQIAWVAQQAVENQR